MTITEAANAPQPPSAEDIQRWLVAHLAASLDVDAQTISLDEPLEAYGLSSREAVSLTGDLEDWLGRRVSPTLVWEYPTIQAIANFLAGGATAAPRSPSASQRPAAAPQTSAAELAELSDEEAEALLLQKLTDLGQ